MTSTVTDVKPSDILTEQKRSAQSPELCVLGLHTIYDLLSTFS